MPIEEGDEVDFEGETYTVMKIYGNPGQMDLAALLRSIDGNKFLLTGMNLLEKG